MKKTYRSYHAYRVRNAEGRTTDFTTRDEAERRARFLGGSGVEIREVYSEDRVYSAAALARARY